MADRQLTLDLTLSVTEKVRHRVKKFGYGDGYEQLRADGINTAVTEYEVTTKPLNAADATYLKTSLDQVAVGDTFLMTLAPFSNVQLRYRLKGNNYSMQFLPATNRRVFTFTLVRAFLP